MAPNPYVSGMKCWESSEASMARGAAAVLAAQGTLAEPRNRTRLPTTGHGRTSFLSYIHSVGQGNETGRCC
jgi:hypothetical protein